MEESPLSHIKREIESRQGLTKTPPVPQSKSKGSASSGEGASASKIVPKTRSSNVSQSAGAGVDRATPSISGGNTAVTVSKRGESVIEEIESRLEEEFEKNLPELYHGDFREILQQHDEWAGTFTLLMLDPPFGILEEEHDAIIPCDDILRACDRLLKKQGMIMMYSLMFVPF